jgi:hypothetical protein
MAIEAAFALSFFAVVIAEPRRGDEAI